MDASFNDSSIDIIKKKATHFLFLHYTAVGIFDVLTGLGYLQKLQLGLYILNLIFIRTKNDKFLTKQTYFHFTSLKHYKSIINTILLLHEYHHNYGVMKIVYHFDARVSILPVALDLENTVWLQTFFW